MQGERAPQPKPLSNGFSENIAYQVLGLHSASETSEAYLILANDQDELWFISNKHVRAHGCFPASRNCAFPPTAPRGLSRCGVGTWRLK